MGRPVGLLSLLVVLLLTVGCTFGTGESAPPNTTTPPPATTAAPTPDVKPTIPAVDAEPPRENGPVATKTEREVESLVWLSVRECSDRLTNLMGTQIAIRFDTSFDQESGMWSVEAFSRDPSVAFGNWIVNDATGAVSHNDDVAGSIVGGELSCQPPISVLATDNTPPHFRIPTPTPTPGPTSVLTPPTPTPLPFLPGRTPVPEPTVSIPSIISTPVPTPTPVPLTNEQAELRVWMATYECFSPRLEASVFEAEQIGPRHALVEGREGTSSDLDLYGLWIVDTITGHISSWDREAQVTMTRSCFKRP
ncbi:MAG: hypothetical protein ACE5Q6_01265 [Dehalococcoidia bacterium]